MSSPSQSPANGIRDSDAGRLLPVVTYEFQHEIEQFLYAEAELLDERRFDEWLELLADDIHYFMPVRTNRLPRDQHLEVRPAREGGHFDEDKSTLRFRVRKLGIEQFWAEVPASRTRHLITNVRIRPASVDGEYQVRSSFHFYRSRHERQVENLIGGREDLLRRADGGYGFQIARRTIYLDQALVLTAGITTFL